jgi:hypothetical protein
LYGIERGLSARSEIRAEINELLSQLEAKNPMPNPTEVWLCIDMLVIATFTRRTSLTL